MTPSAPVTLDDILDRFFSEHDAPTPEALAEAVKLHPEHRDSLVAFATTWLEQRLLPAEAPVGAADERFVVSACARFETAVEAREAANSSLERRHRTASLFELAERAGLGLVGLAPLLDLDVGLVAKLDKRSIRIETLPERLLSAIARAVGCSIREIQDALTGPPAPAVPSFMIVRSAVASRPESFADAVRASTLSEDTKSRWLAGSR